MTIQTVMAKGNTNPLRQKQKSGVLAADYSLNKKLRSSTHSITLYDGYTRYIESKTTF